MNGKIFSIGIFCVLFTFFSISTVSSQNFTRILELKNPRMNGEDVRHLQNRLLSLKFYQVGEADGYYGPMTEDVIKNIQSLSGFEVNGNVNRDFWNFIFNNTNLTFLNNISTVLTYNPMRLQKSRNLLYRELMEIAERGGDAGGEAIIYSSSNGEAKILEYYVANPYTATFITSYFISDSYYFVKYRFEYPSDDFSSRESQEVVYLIENRNFSKIINGRLNRVDDENDITGTVIRMLRMNK